MFAAIEGGTFQFMTMVGSHVRPVGVNHQSVVDI